MRTHHGQEAARAHPGRHHPPIIPNHGPLLCTAAGGAAAGGFPERVPLAAQGECNSADTAAAPDGIPYLPHTHCRSRPHMRPALRRRAARRHAMRALMPHDAMPCELSCRTVPLPRASKTRQAWFRCAHRRRLHRPPLLTLTPQPPARLPPPPRPTAPYGSQQLRKCAPSLWGWAGCACRPIPPSNTAQPLAALSAPEGS